MQIIGVRYNPTTRKVEVVVSGPKIIELSMLEAEQVRQDLYEAQVEMRDHPKECEKHSFKGITREEARALGHETWTNGWNGYQCTVCGYVSIQDSSD